MCSLNSGVLYLGLPNGDFTAKFSCRQLYLANTRLFLPKRIFLPPKSHHLL